MFKKNLLRFLELKNLDLPLKQYAISGSGPMGIRNLREIGDIDIIVDPKLWDTLAKKFGVTENKEGKKIVFPGGLIEAFGKDSFDGQNKDQSAPSIADRIAKAEIIDGLPFEPLERVLYYKRLMGREKDLKDIQLIEEWIKHPAPGY